MTLHQEVLALQTARLAAIPTCTCASDPENCESDYYAGAANGLNDVLRIIEAWTAWQTMETAPKDVDVLLIVPGVGCPVVGRWRPDRYAKTPRPYWGHDRESLFGTRATRQNPPTHWMPLPVGPKG